MVRQASDQDRRSPGAPDGVRIATVFDNYAVDPALQTSWGFSALVVTPTDTVLFDTGGDGAILLENMEKMGFDAAAVDAVVLSHAHGDHVGGLSGFLAENPNVTVYMPASFPGSIRDAVEQAGARVVVVDGPRHIAPAIRTTGELDHGISEQALIVETADGLVVITGCAHPGIVNIIEAAMKTVADRPVALVMGGFHLLSTQDDELARIIGAFRRLGVRQVAPSHCTGDRARRLFEQEYGPDYLSGGVGNLLILP